MATITQTAAPAPYPVRLWMEYPAQLSRLSTFFRIILILPVLFFLALLGGGAWGGEAWNNEQARNYSFSAGGTGGVVLAVWAAIIVSGRIPHWLFDFQVAFLRFTYRAYAYFALLTDQYPAFEGDWFLQYEVDYPEKLTRWKVLIWKFFASIPHFIVLFFLAIAAFVVVVIAWFAILFSGTYPQGLHAFVVGVMRWSARVLAYFQSLTDEYPLFSLD